MASLVHWLFPADQHPAGLSDAVVLLLAVYLTALGLTTPSTEGYLFLRAAIVAPVTIGLYVYYAGHALQQSYSDQWGVGCVTVFFCIKSLELLVFYPAEEYNFRVRPVVLPPSNVDPFPKAVIDKDENSAQCDAKAINTGSPSGKDTTRHGAEQAPEPIPTVHFVREPIPKPWTVAKFYWASSLWWSWRGIGWNYAAPLPSSARSHPYLPGSSRVHYVVRRMTTWGVQWVAFDLCRSYMNLSPARAFFAAEPGSPAYHDLTQWQRGIYSICCAARVCLAMERTHVPCGVVFVIIGGVMGWEGEIWSPWGWPPLFASLADLWRHPGLAHVWSKSWHQEWRRWLYLFGWKGIGEVILGLPASGPPADGGPVSSSLPIDSTVKPSPQTSGESTPTHPLHLGPASTPAQKKEQRAPVQISNFIKSLIVFLLTGIVHDCGSYNLMKHLGMKADLRWTDAITTLPFFILQPFAIAFEEFVKTYWRHWKKKQGGDPDRWLLLERSVAFAWTWIWLGWSAQWFLGSLTTIGYYSREDPPNLFPSVFGGLLWDRWEH